MAGRDEQRAVLLAHAGRGGGRQGHAVAEHIGIRTQLSQGDGFQVAARGILNGDRNCIHRGGAGVGIGIAQGHVYSGARRIEGNGVAGSVGKIKHASRSPRRWRNVHHIRGHHRIPPNAGAVGNGAAGQNASAIFDHRAAAARDDGNHISTLVKGEQGGGPHIVRHRHAVSGRTVGDIKQAGRRRIQHDHITQHDQAVVINGNGILENIVGTDARGRIIGIQRGRLLDYGLRERQHRGAHIQKRIARPCHRRILAPGRGDQGAIEGIDPHGGLVLIGIVDDLRLQGRHRKVGVITIPVGIGERTRLVSIVVHIQYGGAHGRDPDRTAILAQVTAARPPAHLSDRGEIALRHQGEAPVVYVVRGRVGAHRFHGKVRRAVRTLELGPRILRHLVLVGPVGRHGKVGGTNLGRDQDGQGAGARIVDEHIGRIAIPCSPHGRVIGGAPLVGWIKGEPARFVVRPDIARDQMNLNRLGGQHAGPLQHAAIHPGGLTAVKRENRLIGPIGILVQTHRRAVFGRHDKQVHDLVHAGRGYIFANRGDKLGAVIEHGTDFNGVSQHAARVQGPSGTRNDNSFGCSNAIPSIVEDGGRTPRQGHIIAK